MLGIGRCGSRKTKPQWKARELAQELINVVIGHLSTAMREKAEELAELCKKNGLGAEMAARSLLAECPRPSDLDLDKH